MQQEMEEGVVFDAEMNPTWSLPTSKKCLFGPIILSIPGALSNLLSSLAQMTTIYFLANLTSLFCPLPILISQLSFST